jgi:hypothetical protein
MMIEVILQKPINDIIKVSFIDAFVAYMFKVLSKPYLKIFKRNKKAWPLKKADFLLFETDSLGYKIGDFLNKNGYELEAKMEEHDVYHVLSNTQTQVFDEIRLQFYMYGNGKRSIFLTIVLLTGFVLYTSKLRDFKNAYQKGKSSLPFHQIDFNTHLHISYDTIISKFNIQSNNI